MRKMEGRSLQVEGLQEVPELRVSQVLTKEKDGPESHKISTSKLGSSLLGENLFMVQGM